MSTDLGGGAQNTPPPPGALLNVNAEMTKATAEAARLLSGGKTQLEGGGDRRPVVGATAPSVVEGVVRSCASSPPPPPGDLAIPVPGAASAGITKG